MLLEGVGVHYVSTVDVLCYTMCIYCVTPCEHCGSYCVTIYLSDQHL